MRLMSREETDREKTRVRKGFREEGKRDEIAMGD